MTTETGSAGPAREPLSFASDKGAWRSRAIAALIALALIGWMGSGYLIPSEEALDAAIVPAEPEPVTVAVRESVAEPITLFLAAEGQARPERTTQVPAEASGEIAELRVAKGQDVEAGAVITVIDAAQRMADLERARAEEARAARELGNARTLLSRGVATVDRVSQAEASLASARAALAAAEEQIASLEIIAPFAGRIETLEVRAGEFIQAGSPVVTLVDSTPLTVEIRVPQQVLASLEVGLPAEVTFITGQTREGAVSFIGTAADAETRTFLAEIEVPNPGGLIPAGVSAEVRIPTGLRVAHLVSPAILSLGSDGALGIKTLGEEDRVAFNEIEIVRAESRGVWVTGLPDQAVILTVGQGFVSAGERVTPRSEEELLPAEEEEAPEPREPVTAMTGVPVPAEETTEEIASEPTTVEETEESMDVVVVEAPEEAAAQEVVVEEAPEAAPAPQTPEAAPSPAALPLTIRIVIAQGRLAARGYDVGPATGAVNPRTRIAVARYQEAEGLPVTGDLDEATLTRIETAPAAPAEIALLQETLEELGYDPGGVDGVLGPGTRRALADFQADSGLPATGDPDLATGAAIVRSVQEREE